MCINKKSFTLSEVLVALTIVGVIVALIVPFMIKAKPDKDAMFFKKAFYNVVAAAENATDKLKVDGAWEDVWASDIADKDGGFCQRMANELKTSRVDCSQKNYPGSYDNPQIITTDGVRYWHLPINKFAKRTVGGVDTWNQTFAVERALSDREKENNGELVCNMRSIYADVQSASFQGYDGDCFGITLTVNKEGKVYVYVAKNGDAHQHTYPAYLLRNNFKVQKDN